MNTKYNTLYNRLSKYFIKYFDPIVKSEFASSMNSLAKISGLRREKLFRIFSKKTYNILKKNLFSTITQNCQQTIFSTRIDVCPLDDGRRSILKCFVIIKSKIYSEKQCRLLNEITQIFTGFSPHWAGKCSSRLIKELTDLVKRTEVYELLRF